VYNWGNPNAAYGGEVHINGGQSSVNMIGNYYKPGPATPGTLKFVQAYYTAASAKGIGQWFLSGNVMSGNGDLSKNNFKGLDLERLPAGDRPKAIASKPFPVSVQLPEHNAADAYAAVLDNAGATLPKRDAVDTRIVHETKTGTASGSGSFGKPGIIDSPAAVSGWPVYNSLPAPADTDHDGMPDEWEKSHGLDAQNAADGNKVGADGYTMLENYLNGFK
jgi:hypothetical protein